MIVNDDSNHVDTDGSDGQGADASEPDGEGDDTGVDDSGDDENRPGDDDDDDDERPDDDDDRPDDDRPDDDDDDGEISYGTVEIVFDGEMGAFCEGEAWFYADSSKFYGEGACELQAGPGAGEVVTLYFEGEPDGRNYEGEVSSDWAPPEGDGMPDAAFDAQVGERYIKVEWDNQVSTPEGGNVNVEGYGEAEL